MGIIISNGITIGSGITISTISEPAPPSIVSSNLVLHLDASNPLSYDYPTGTNVWFDLTNNNFDATTSGAGGVAFSWLTSQNTDAHFVFDKIITNNANGHANIAHNSLLSLSTTQSKTFQLWIYFDPAALLVNDSTIINKISSSYAFDGYTLRVNANGSMRFVTNGGTIAKSTMGHINKFVANTWYFITVHSLISNAANSTRVYVSSNTINTTPYISTAHGTDSYSEDNTLSIGLPGAGTAGTGLRGARIAAVYFYDKQLSLAEIEENYNATKAKFGY